MLKFHQVQEGDTLSDIAVKYRASWKDLSKKNKLRDPDKLQPGDIIMIPEAEQKDEPSLPVETANTSGTSAAMPPYGESGKPYEAPEPYTTSWPQYAKGSEPREAPRVSEVPAEAPQPREASLEGPGWSKPYPVHGNPQAERGRSPGDMGSAEGAVRPTLDAITDPSFWKDFLTTALPTAMMGMRAPGARMGPHMPDPKTPPRTPAQAKWLEKEKNFFDKNPGALDDVDPGYAAAREAGLAPKSNKGPGGGELTPEGKAADVKDWNFYRNQGKDSKATPFPRKNPPVKETYDGTSAAADTRPGVKDFATVIARELADKYFGVPQGGGGRPFYDPEVTAFGARARSTGDNLQRNQDAASGTPDGPHSDYAKGTTVNKRSAKFTLHPDGRKSAEFSDGPGSSHAKSRKNPFSDAVQRGMEKPGQEGSQVAGEVVPFQRPMSQQDKYDHAVSQQKLEKIVHSLLEKPHGSWTDDDIALVKSLLGEE